MAVRKTTAAKTGATGILASAKSVGNWESNNSRIFEVRRKKVEFDLDIQVTKSLEKCRDYLQEVHDRTPNLNGIVEAIILEGLASNTEFQKWADKKESGVAKAAAQEAAAAAADEDLLENIGTPPAAVNPAKIPSGAALSV